MMPGECPTSSLSSNFSPFHKMFNHILQQISADFGILERELLVVCLCQGWAKIHTLNVSKCKKKLSISAFQIQIPKYSFYIKCKHPALVLIYPLFQIIPNKMCHYSHMTKTGWSADNPISINYVVVCK